MLELFIFTASFVLALASAYQIGSSIWRRKMESDVDFLIAAMTASTALYESRIDNLKQQLKSQPRDRNGRFVRAR